MGFYYFWLTRTWGFDSIQLVIFWSCGGVVTHRSAKPFTPVQFRTRPQELVLAVNSEYNKKALLVCPSGEIGIHKGLKIPRMNNPCEFKSRLGHQNQTFRNFYPSSLSSSPNFVFRFVKCAVRKLMKIKEKTYSRNTIAIQVRIILLWHSRIII